MKTDGLGEIGDSVRAELDAKHKARETALSLSRDLIRLSANTIRNVHRAEFDAARAMLDEGRQNLEQTKQALADHPDIYFAGYVQDAQKEFAEACTTLALIAGDKLPTPSELGVTGTAYLNGIGETIGELRRHLLDALRGGDMEHCEDTLAAMGDIYDVIVTMDYPEAVTAGLRRTADAMRAILERTRGDFTITYTQRRLEERLAEFEKRYQA
ncbi:MAG TPA: haloacid dehalogenase [Dehalococcoidia bacterium]|nr:haloacid dehalogenase [Dehalococcoidia bacterium]